MRPVQTKPTHAPKVHYGDTTKRNSQESESRFRGKRVRGETVMDNKEIENI